MDEVLEETNEFLELALLEEVDIPLMMSQSTSMSILEGNWAIEKCVVPDAEFEKCIFTTSLMGTTIQDGGKRERSEVAESVYLDLS